METKIFPSISKVPHPLYPPQIVINSMCVWYLIINGIDRIKRIWYLTLFPKFKLCIKELLGNLHRLHQWGHWWYRAKGTGSQSGRSGWNPTSTMCCVAVGCHLHPSSFGCLHLLLSWKCKLHRGMDSLADTSLAPGKVPVPGLGAR